MIRFRNGMLVSKSSFDFESGSSFTIILLCQNEYFASKLYFSFKIELCFQNGVSISKFCFDLEIELQFQNRGSIWKRCIDSEINPRRHIEIRIPLWTLRFWNWSLIFKCNFFDYNLFYCQVVPKVHECL